MLRKIAAPVIALSFFATPLLASAQTMAELQAQIQALLAQVSAMQGQSSSPSTSTTSASDDTPTSPQASLSCPALTSTIQRGARDATTGGQVTELQVFLADSFGLDEESVVSGFFGKTTERYLVQFQKKYGLPAYGIAGSLTRAKIASICGTTTLVGPATKICPQYQRRICATGEEVFVPAQGSALCPLAPTCRPKSEQTSIQLNAPLQNATFGLGQSIPIAWNVQGVTASPSQVLLNLKAIDVGGGISGGTWQSAKLPLGSSSDTYAWRTGSSYLTAKGAYGLTAYVVACDTADCNGNFDSQGGLGRIRYAVSSPVVIRVTDPTVPSAAGPLVVSTDASSPSYSIVAAGSERVTIGTARLRASGENISISKINLGLSSGSPMDITQVWVDGPSGPVGTTVFAGSSKDATITLTNPLILQRDTDTILTIKASIANIGTSQAGVPGDLVQININGVSGSGVISGSNISSTGVTNVAGVRIFRSYPTVVMDSLPTTGLADGRLMRFAVSAHSAGSISLTEIALRIEGLASNTNGQVDLYGFTDSGYSQPISGFTGGAINGLAVTSASAGGYLWFPKPVVIPAGTMYYFELRDSTKGTGLTNTSNLVTSLLGQSTYAGLVSVPSLNSNGMMKDVMFVWSPNDYAVSQSGDNDWTNAYGVPGLPPSGFSQARTGSVIPTTPTIPLATYRAYLSNSAAANITTNNISRADALANCNLNKSSNPLSAIRCTWGDETILSFTPVTIPTAPASCTFNGQSVPSGTSVTAYLYPAGMYSGGENGQVTCDSQTRLCTNGVLAGTYQYGQCSVTEVWGGGDGGGAMIPSRSNIAAAAATYENLIQLLTQMVALMRQ